MIVVFCHIRLYILDLGISFPFFFGFSSTFTNRFLAEKKNISKHPKMYKSLFIKLLDGVSSERSLFALTCGFFKISKKKKKTSKLCLVNSYL